MADQGSKKKKVNKPKPGAKFPHLPSIQESDETSDANNGSPPPSPKSESNKTAAEQPPKANVAPQRSKTNVAPRRSKTNVPQPTTAKESGGSVTLQPSLTYVPPPAPRQESGGIMASKTSKTNVPSPSSKTKSDKIGTPQPSKTDIPPSAPNTDSGRTGAHQPSERYVPPPTPRQESGGSLVSQPSKTNVPSSSSKTKSDKIGTPQPSLTYVPPPAPKPKSGKTAVQKPSKTNVPSPSPTKDSVGSKPELLPETSKTKPITAIPDAPSKKRLPELPEIPASSQWQHDWKPPPDEPSLPGTSESKTKVEQAPSMTTAKLSSPPKKPESPKPTADPAVQPNPQSKPATQKSPPPENSKSPKAAAQPATEPSPSKDKVKPTITKPPTPKADKKNPTEAAGNAEKETPDAPDLTPSVIAVTKGMPPSALKSIRVRRGTMGSTPERPIAPKIIILKKAPGSFPPVEEPNLTTFDDDLDYPYVLHDDEKLHDVPDDKTIDKKLTEMLNAHREYLLRKLKRAKKDKEAQFRFPEMAETLTNQGIPCPINEDFARLQGLHNKWDPQGTVLEYFSPMLRTFVPVNMRGRYRGCWNTDNCVTGLNISNLKPKRDALEGFVDRGRHANIQKNYDEMSSVALDEPHLDYLIEIQSYHAETLPIPIFYDMLHLGIEVANENLRVLVQEEGYAPNDPVFISAHGHAEQLRRKIQMYGALGLETLESERKGLGQYRPEWIQTREELIRDIMKRKDSGRYTSLNATEIEAGVKGGNRRENTRFHFGSSSKASKSKGEGEGLVINQTSETDLMEVTSTAGESVTVSSKGSSGTPKKAQLTDTIKKIGSNKVSPAPDG